MVRCACGLEVVLRTSWTNWNPGHRFYGCPTLIIPGLLRSRNELEEILAMVEEKRRKEVVFLLDVLSRPYISSFGLRPNSMDPRHNGAGPEIKNLQSGRIGSGL
ncbi:hypothetical protein Tco_0156608, partial [Tanacetum coccineum]